MSARPNAASGGPNNWMNAPRPIGVETPRKPAPRWFDPWTNPNHLPAGFVDRIKAGFLDAEENERRAYMVGDYAAADRWAMLIDYNDTGNRRMEYTPRVSK